MNKIAKASIAGAAGVILLMGGAGSLAYWNNSTNLGSASGQTINAGTLSATTNSDGKWTSSFAGGTATNITSTIGSFKIVPGDTLTYTESFNVNATGNDLYFTVGATQGALGTGTLASRLSAGATFAVTGATVSSGTGAATVYKAPTGTMAITVTETVAWPFGTTGDTSPSLDNPAMGGSVSLGQGAVTLTQVNHS